MAHSQKYKTKKLTARRAGNNYDSLTGFRPQIHFTDHKIHTGEHFFIKTWVDVEGAAITGVNNDGDSTNTPELTAFSGPTVTSDGTLIWAAKVGAGKDATVAPGLNYDIIAKTDSIYLFKLTKIPAGTHYIDVDFWWFEHS